MTRRRSLMNAARFALGLAALPLLGGCGGAPGNYNAEGTTQDFEKPATTAPPPKADNLKFEDLTPRQKKQKGNG